MLLPAIKRRWPVLTTGVAALLWIVNNYDIRGLDGLHLEPRSAAPTQATGYATQPFGFPTGYSAGPLLPSTSSTYNAAGYNAAGYNTSNSGMRPSTSPVGGVGSQTGMILPNNLRLDSLKPAVEAMAGDDWNKLLSVGEKFGMLDSSRQAAAAPATLTPLLPAPPGVGNQLAAMPVMAGVAQSSIRIASFNLNGWGDAQRNQPAINDMIARLISQFDVIALQDIRSRRDDVLPNLMNQLNSTGRSFDFMIGPRIGRGDTREQLAFVFDTAKVETDRFQLYSVADPEDLLAREPLVGWFRAKHADSREAFTFSLVNVHIDSSLSTTELDLLPNLVEAIFADGRGEDDVILAGDFSAAAERAAFLRSGVVRTAIEGIATNTQGTLMIDNIVMPVAGNSEYTGRSGAIDFLRQYNLSLEQAIGISEHLPIWAEFSIIEGGRPGQIAGNATPEHSFQSGLPSGGLRSGGLAN